GAELGRRPQGGGRPRAGPEVPDRYVPTAILLQPPGGREEALRQEPDVEHVGPVVLLPWRQEVEQQRGHPGLVQPPGHAPIPWAGPAAAAAVGEHHRPGRGPRHDQVAPKGDRAGWDEDLVLGAGFHLSNLAPWGTAYPRRRVAPPPPR